MKYAIFISTLCLELLFLFLKPTAVMVLKSLGMINLMERAMGTGFHT